MIKKHKRAKRTKPTKNYIDNKKFLEELVSYRQSVADAAANGLDKPPISNYIGECFLDLAKNISYSSNFINYTFKEDFCSDGVENCIRYMHNFDPAISSNPFAYFTQIIRFAFLRRIKNEKKQTYIKFKSLEISSSEDNEEFRDVIRTHYGSLVLYKDEFIKKYEDSMQKPKKVKASPLDAILDITYVVSLETSDDDE